MPGREKFRDQSIKARFFILGLPLFPTGAIYQVTPSLGIPVPLTGHDTLHAFAKIHSPLLGVGAFLLAQEAARNATAFAAVLGLIALGLIALGLIALGLIGFGVYSWIKVRDAAPEDHLKRRIFGKAFQYNMPPEYLPKDLARKLQGELVNNYLLRHRNVNWQGHVDSGVVTKRDLLLQPNRYGIKKLTAEGKEFYNTGLLGKDLDISVSKHSHTLLEIIGVRH